MTTAPERLIAFYEAMNEGLSVTGRIDSIYAPGVRYTDPIQAHHGSAAIRGSFERMFARYRVHVSDITMLGDERRVLGTWVMTLQPRIGPTLRINGAAAFVLEDGLVVRHDDYWDLLGTGLAALPALEPIYRWAVGKLFL
ncbi:MAG: nuclear transport factor 2 family protein [Byssovorax sp.]